MNSELHHMMVDDILELARIGTGKVHAEQAPFSPRQVIGAVVSRCGGQAKGIELREDLAAELPALLIGDAGRLARVLENLLKNALAVTRHGYIALSAGVHHRYQGGISLEFAVQDSGSGEAAEGEAQLSLELSALDADAIRGNGAGLGLALCKALVTLMGGEIWCDGIPGLGNTFSFRLPLGDAAADGSTAAQRAAASSPSLSGKRVLLAEDNPFNQQVACALLERSGLSVTLAQNGAEAVELVSRLDFDLVLMDVQMPLMDGLAAVRAIRLLPKPGMAELPILAVSANAMEHDVKASLAAGMNDHLCKPFTPDSLYGCMAHWLKKGAVRTMNAGVAGACAPSPPQGLAPVDFEAGVRLTGGDTGLYRDLLERFRQEYGARGEEVRRELALGNRQEATRLAHSVKGVAGVLAAYPLHGAALRLESALKGGDDGAEQLLAEFQAQLSRALAYLRELEDAVPS